MEVLHKNLFLNGQILEFKKKSTPTRLNDSEHTQGTQCQESSLNTCVIVYTKEVSSYLQIYSSDMLGISSSISARRSSTSSPSCSRRSFSMMPYLNVYILKKFAIVENPRNSLKNPQNLKFLSYLFFLCQFFLHFQVNIQNSKTQITKHS